MKKLSDELATRAKAGDKSAVRELYAQLAAMMPPCVRMWNARTGSWLTPEECAETAQDILLAVFRMHLPQWKPGGGRSFRTWCYSMTKWHVLRAIQRVTTAKRDRRATFSLDQMRDRDDDDRAPWEPAAPHVDPTLGIQREELHAAIAGLPPKWREVIVVDFLREGTVKEVGLKYGVTHQAADYWKQRALKRLRLTA